MHGSLEILFCGGARRVTGSNFLVRSKDVQFLIDCGMFQGDSDSLKRNTQAFPYDPKRIDALFVTHAHADHIGRIPQLVKKGFRGPIYSTPPTKDIAALMFADSVGIFTREAEEQGGDPLYDERDVKSALALWETREYRDPIALPDGLSVSFRDAGHILGSAMVEIARGERRLVFTGDLGNSPAPLLHDTEPIDGVHYLVTESVYGDRSHEDVEVRKKILRDMVVDTARRGGTLMIPAFSVERTQSLLFELNDLVEHEKVPPVPMYLDSPLAIKVTEAYKRHKTYFNSRAHDVIASGDNIFSFPTLTRTEDVKASIDINDVEGPKVIIAGSGMSDGGRILHHEKRYLPNPDSTLLLVGYQAPGTPGRRIAEGAKEVMIDGEPVPVKARIVALQGYSAHKDADALLAFVETAADSLLHVYVTLGEPSSAFFFAQRIKDMLGIPASVPEEGQRAVINM